MAQNILIALIFSFSLLSCNENKKSNATNAFITNGVDTLLEIPNKTVDKSTLFYNNKTSLWTLNGQLYSGYAVSFYQDNILRACLEDGFAGEKHHFFDETRCFLKCISAEPIRIKKKNDVPSKKCCFAAQRLTSRHALKEKIGILNGRKQNQATQWYQDGHVAQVANYHRGKLHGEKKMWSADSNHILIAHLNYHLGKAHGEQKKWYSTGALFKKLNLNMGKEEGIQQAFRKNGDLFANYEAREGRIFGLKKAALCFGLEDENVQYEK